MQFWSFDSRDPVFNIDGWQLSIQIVTLENTYGLAEEHCRVAVDAEAATWHVTCDRLSWAAQQQTALGACEIDARVDADGHLRVHISAQAPHKIRCIKLFVRGLPRLVVLDALDQPLDVPSEGIGMHYPNQLRLPLGFVRALDGSAQGSTLALGFRCEDPHVRAKRFAIYEERFGPLAGTHTVELIVEDDARHFDTHFDTPEWVLGRGVAVHAFRDDQLAFTESALGLVPWGQRRDMPAWALGTSLCLTLHGMHWSGYVFNTYAQMADILRFVADRIEGARVLAYLPGWEGRYYWQYGDYRAEPLLGGDDGFAQLCQIGRDLGIHLMPMFGGNCANAWLPNFHAYGPDAYMKSATRNRFHGNQPDWDMARAHDTGWQAWLNPGHPAWQDELCGQILRLQERYGFDAVFLDTIHVWTNDPDHSVFEGIRQIVARLRDGRPDLLVTAENWYDAMLGVFPIFQHTAHWHAVPGWVSRYARLVAHLLDQEPSRGSTGVHERGFKPYQTVQTKEGFIPTMAFVDGTLDAAKDQVEAVITQAKEYAERYA